MKTVVQSWKARQGREWLLAPVDGASLATFRIIFGLIMLVEVVRYFRNGWIRRYYVEPEFFFSYISWIKPWPGDWMYVHFAGLGILAVLIGFGLFYRVAAWLFFFGFTYVFLLDKANYLNHFYLVSLVSLLMALVPAARVMSLDRWRGKISGSEEVPRWTVTILRLQVVLVYFFGGIAKINPDWLQGEPQRTWMAAKSGYVLGPILVQEWFIQVLTYGGLLIDLTVGFLLLGRRTFWLGVVLVVLFNLSNAYLFSIGIFPFFMIGTLVLFGRPDWPRRVFEWAPAIRERGVSGGLAPWRGWEWSREATVLFAVYLFLQVLVPLRHWLYQSNVHWSEEGHRFSWHMMLRSKQVTADFYVLDPTTGESERVFAEKMLSSRQSRKMPSRPDMIWQFCQYLADRYEMEHGERPIVRAHVAASLNGRGYRLLIDPEADLGVERMSVFRRSRWILPMEGESGMVEKGGG